MDKIKIYSTNQSSISKEIIKNKFKQAKDPKKYIEDDNLQLYYNHKHNDTSLIINKYGSLLSSNPTTFSLPNNLNQINRNQLKDFKERFEEDLKINTDFFSLTGFDYNINIETQYPPLAYLPSIRSIPRYLRDRFNPNGITFFNNCKSFGFYDKIKEMGKKEIPIDYSNKNVLRIELGIDRKMHGTTKTLNRIHTLHDLTNSDNYISVIDLFNNIYNKVQKQPIFKYKNMTSPNPALMNLNDFALTYYINEIGMTEYLNLLQQEKEMKITTYRQWKYKKDKAFSLWETYSNLNFDKNDLLEEMNNKVHNKIVELKDLAMAV